MTLTKRVEPNGFVIFKKVQEIFTKAQQFYIIDLTKLPSMMTEERHHWE